MRRRCHNDWRKQVCGMILLSLGIGMFLAILLPSCIFLVATALICCGIWLIRISRF
ncbi:MAG TPA: hypothetical protein H9733_00695 [Candidatus Anaerotignum merdipullorum]|nr:hypothetical protein [Candidatus Anaerotignum merdipullorum]